LSSREQRGDNRKAEDSQQQDGDQSTQQGLLTDDELQTSFNRTRIQGHVYRWLACPEATIWLSLH
jgi:hypothetical protein